MSLTCVRKSVNGIGNSTLLLNLNNNQILKVMRNSAIAHNFSFVKFIASW